MIDCRQATQLVSKREEKKLSSWEKIELAFHLFICKYCKAFAKNSELINRIISRPPKAQLSDSEKEKMQKELEELKGS